MGKVVFDISMSLDWFMTAANQRPEEPLGEGGERLHEWAFGDDPRDREVLAGGAGSLGAVVCGRRADTGRQFIEGGVDATPSG